MVRKVVLIFFIFILFILYVEIASSNPEHIYLLIAVFILIALFIIEMQIEGNRKRQREYEQKLLQSGIYQVDSMSGSTFEDYLATLLKAKGYKVEQTPASGDYGVDLLLSARSMKIAVQAKRYSDNVGIKAVQEVSSARNYYGVDECWVITNSYFTIPAINLAKSNDVRLIDRDQLIEWMLEEKKRMLI